MSGIKIQHYTEQIGDRNCSIGFESTQDAQTFMDYSKKHEDLFQYCLGNDVELTVTPSRATPNASANTPQERKWVEIKGNGRGSKVTPSVIRTINDSIRNLALQINPIARTQAGKSSLRIQLQSAADASSLKTELLKASTIQRNYTVNLKT